jgi:4-amino-4-deoxy-L-arabinose transferase-like glycosyltransferase
VLTLAAHAATGRPWLGRLLLLWWMVPLAVMSVGTSKLIHYAYPFLPPLALGAGLAVDVLFRVLERGFSRVSAAAVQAFPWITWAANDPASRRRSRVRQLLVGGAAFAAALSAWTAVAGPFRWEVQGIELLKNSSVSRPLVVAAVLLGAAGRLRHVGAILAIAAVAVMLPVSEYPLNLERLSSVAHPLRTARDCAATVRATRPETHVYATYDQLLDHAPYYYLRRVGPWVEHGGNPQHEELRRRLFVAGQESLVVLSRADYRAFLADSARVEAEARRTPRGLELSDVFVLLMPGPFEVCATSAFAAGGREVEAR